MIQRAGFPPIHLAEINFEALYQQRLQQQAAAAGTAGGKALDLRSRPHAMIRAAAAALAFALAASASAAEYASVGTAGAVLYDGPSPSATKLFVAPKGMPIELISVIRLWVKVRDVFGDVMWIERGDIRRSAPS